MEFVVREICETVVCFDLYSCIECEISDLCLDEL